MVESTDGLKALLPGKVWRALIDDGVVQRFARDEEMLRQGESGSHVLVLIAGHVKISRVEWSGDELLLAVRGPGEVLGELSVLDGTHRSATVTAMDHCITYVLSAARFHRIIEQSHSQDLLLRHIVARYREGEHVRAELAALSAPRRVATVLLRFGNVVGGEQPSLALSQQELAAAAGLSRAAITAQLTRLRRRGLITTGRRRIMIHDPDGLRVEAE